MKTIPKFTDLIAEAVRFEEDSPDELISYQSQRQRYYFDDECLEVIGMFTDDKGLREAIEEIKNFKAQDQACSERECDMASCNGNCYW